jgi:hypothetical protein
MTTEQQTPCGAETRWCQCGDKPPGGHQGDYPSGHHQRGHARDANGVRRGPCLHEGCKCQGFKGWPCMDVIVIPEIGRCRRHGGKSLVGVAAPSFRGRGRSRYLPVKLREHYEESLSDPDLLSLRSQIATLEAFEKEVLQSLKDGDLIASAVFNGVAAVTSSKRKFLRARQLSRNDPVTGQPDAESARRVGEAMGDMLDAIGQLEAAMDPAEQQKTARETVAELDMKIRQTKRDENMRLEQLHSMLTTERAMALQTALAMSLKEVIDAHVTDAPLKATVLRAVATRFGELTRRRDD